MSITEARFSTPPEVPQGMHYAGDVLPADVWAQLKGDENAVLVDVRTEAEWAFVGYPALTSIGKKPVLLSWRMYPDFDPNLTFVQNLTQVIADKNTPLFFLCKTGGRSRDAAEALAQQGYKECYNVKYGFEGDPNSMGQRGAVNGWKAEGLAWQQA